MEDKPHLAETPATDRFDRDRFDELAAKADAGTLTDDETAELRAQVAALEAILDEIAELLRPIIAPVVDALQPLFELVEAIEASECGDD